MASARRILATTIALTGVAVGVATCAAWIYAMWPAGMNPWKHLNAGMGFGVIVGCVVTLPFSWLAGRIDPTL